MGNQQSGAGGGGKDKGEQKEKKKYEPPVPTRVGKKRKKVKGPDAANKLPGVTPHTKCRLRLLKMERIKDYLLMEEEFIRFINFYIGKNMTIFSLETRNVLSPKRRRMRRSVARSMT